MREVFEKLKNYQEPRFGSMGWLSTQAGYNKLSLILDEDEDVKRAVTNLVAMSVKEAAK